MRADIHPKNRDVKVICSCGHERTMRSALGESELRLDVCSECHPFYTGKQKVLDATGRVERFNQRYAAAAAKPSKAKEGDGANG